MDDTRPPRPLGLRLIVLYKLAKAPLMLALALWLTFHERRALVEAERFAELLTDHGTLLAPLGEWLSAHLTRKAVSGAAVLAWLDTVSSLLEAALLWSGTTWGEWIVTIELALLLPLEADAFVRHPSVPKAATLVVNAAIVAYLLARRVHQRHGRQLRGADA